MPSSAKAARDFERKMAMPDREPPVLSFRIVGRPGDPAIDLIMLGCLHCGASVFEVENQQGDLCPLCRQEPDE